MKPAIVKEQCPVSSKSGWTLPVRTTGGEFVAHYSPKGLCRLDFPSRKPAGKAAPTPGTAGATAQVRRWHNQVSAALTLALRGRPPGKLPPLDVSIGTEFQQQVWQGMRHIPSGQTRSYGELARLIGRSTAVRALGGACGANPIPVFIPCHRVVAAHGKLGGFSGGLDWKRLLLAREGRSDVAASLPIRVTETIRKHGLLANSEPVLVAVSGGVDSMVLLHLLHELSRVSRWRITVAHFNHQLRGRASNADEQLVRRAARALRLPFVCGRADVRDHARRNHLSLEMAARELRHNFLARQAKRLHIPAIALAHHADDQVELFFLRLLRGSGGHGLGGMTWSGPSPAAKDIRVIRPLLDVSKSTLQACARRQQIEFREDATNTSLDIQRNRVRHELLPWLRKQYQPALERTILRVMEIVSADAEYVANHARDWLEAVRPTPFESLPPALQRSILQRQLQARGFGPDFELIEQLRGRPGRPVMLRAQAVSGKVRTRGQMCLARNAAGRLHLEWQQPLAFRRQQVQLPLAETSGETEFARLKLEWKREPCTTLHLPPRRPGRERFDADKVGSQITLRHWRPGDRFQPIGMKTAVKLQDFLTNAKVPAQQRRQLVVAVAQNGEIFWVEGLRISERFKLEKGTRSWLNWTWRR